MMRCMMLGGVSTPQNYKRPTRELNRSTQETLAI